MANPRKSGILQHLTQSVMKIDLDKHSVSRVRKQESYPDNDDSQLMLKELNVY